MSVVSMPSKYKSAIYFILPPYITFGTYAYVWKTIGILKKLVVYLYKNISGVQLQIVYLKSTI